MFLDIFYIFWSGWGWKKTRGSQGRPIAVSYTHLDVYKRQNLLRIAVVKRKVTGVNNNTRKINVPNEDQ